MVMTDGAQASLMEGVIRGISKQLYGKGPRQVRCVCRGGVCVIRCTGILSAIEQVLAEQGTKGVSTLKRIRRELFDKECELIRGKIESPDMQVGVILQDFSHDKDERTLVVLTKKWEERVE